MHEAHTPLRYVKGVGPRRAEHLARAGLETVEDLLYQLPFRYEDRRAFARIADLAPGGGDRTLEARIVGSRLIRTRRRGFTIFEAQLADASGTIRGVWYNQPYLERVLVTGRRVALFGSAATDRHGRRILDNADYEVLDEEDAEGIHTGRIVPVYRKVADVGSRGLRQLVSSALAELDPESLVPLVPGHVLEARDLPGRARALADAHFPPAGVRVEELGERRTPAHRTLAFEEIFVLQLALARRRHDLRREGRTVLYEIPDGLRTRLGRMLPFRLTVAQKRVLKEIGADLTSGHPMNRLLQGDVGSGKTIVALLALLVAVENGHQGALMAPTEILAEQHDRNLRRLLEQGGIDWRVALLTGSLRPAVRRRTLADVASGMARIVVGTHALFEEGVAFSGLGLVVVDEQHRFGVLQRAALARKGPRPDVLVMTATPIPRSLALTLYGDLDLSVIDELPPGRTPVVTRVRSEEDRPKLYAFLRREIERGRRVYFVVPLVEETEKSDLKAATAFAEELRRDAFAHVGVGMLHGRMKAEEKEAVMRRFVAGELPVLVATTVIEVGVDVPSASVMVVEHAERFGLSQLHQLRGRVGRGSARSYCVLMETDGGGGREARERLKVMERTTDGFVIAQKDLDLRGPGAVFGTQQHGLSDLQFLALMLKDPGLVEAARREAETLLTTDEARAASILEALGGRWRRRLGLAQVG